MSVPDIIMPPFIDWIDEHISLILVIILTLAVVYAIWQDGYERGRKVGYRSGFINGIAHDIQTKAIPGTNDHFITEAQRNLLAQRDRNRPYDTDEMP